MIRVDTEKPVDWAEFHSWRAAMLKILRAEWWAYDLEWAPDPAAGRRVLGLDESMSDLEVVREMWREGGATEENPQPFLKLILCRILSVAAVIRRANPSGKEPIELRSLGEGDERTLIERFLHGVGKGQPQLIGFNSKGADLLILLQRALVHGLSLPELFGRGPERPPDYFHRYDDSHVDLMDLISSFRGRSPSLHEIAVLSGIPGKRGIDGAEVPALWLQGEHKKIVAYNECDAVTTYLLWIRFLHLLGRLTSEGYREEQTLVHGLLERESATKPHLGEYLEEWGYRC